MAGRAQAVGLALAATVLLSLALVGFANRRVPPATTISFPGRPLARGDTVDWVFDAAAPLPPESVVLSGTWAVRTEADRRRRSRARGSRRRDWSRERPAATRGVVCQTAGGSTGLLPLDFLRLDKRFPLLVLGEAVFDDVRVEDALPAAEGDPGPGGGHRLPDP